MYAGEAEICTIQMFPDWNRHKLTRDVAFMDFIFQQDFFHATNGQKEFFGSQTQNWNIGNSYVFCIIDELNWKQVH